MDNLFITSIKVNDDFTIDIILSNGKLFIFDIKTYLSGAGFKKLRNFEFFEQAKFDRDMLYWDNMHDFPLHCMDISDDILK